MHGQSNTKQAFGGRVFHHAKVRQVKVLMEQHIYFRRLLEAVPILKDESAPGKIVVTSNGQTFNNGDTKNEGVKPESIHSSPRGVIAQVSLTSCEKCFFDQNNLLKLSGILIKQVIKLPLKFCNNQS